MNGIPLLNPVEMNECNRAGVYQEILRKVMWSFLFHLVTFNKIHWIKLVSSNRIAHNLTMHLFGDCICQVSNVMRGIKDRPFRSEFRFVSFDVTASTLREIKVNQHEAR